MNKGDDMEKQSWIKKVWNYILNFFKLLILGIINIINYIFKIEKKKEEPKKKEIMQNNPKKEITAEQKTADTAVLPETNNSKSNAHSTSTDDEENNASNDLILKLPKKKFENLKNNKKLEKHLLFTKEEIENLIDKELEDLYKEEKFKVKEASKEVKEKIKKIKEKIVPKILDKIEKEIITTKEELVQEVKTEVKKEIQEKPLFPKIEKEETKKEIDRNITPKQKEIYFIAYPKQKNLNTKENTRQKAKGTEKIISIPSTDEINKSIINAPMTMVRNVEEIPKTDIKTEVKNAAIAASLITAATTLDLLKPEEKKEEKLPPEEKRGNEKATTTEKKEPPIELPELKSVSAELQEGTKTIEELEKLQEVIAEKMETLEKKEEKAEKQKKPEQQEQQEKQPEQIKDLVKDTEIAALSKTSDAIIEDSKKEISKEDFEEKDYDYLENQIDRMLENISNTYLRYGDKLSTKQKDKLKAEENKLRNAKEIIRNTKQQDIKEERDLLQGDIKETEILGIQEELKKMHLEYKAEASEELFKKMEKLEGMTQEQVANADKRIMMKRLNKASLLMEMTSILAFPFIRNRYFFYFTVGLIVDNHFNFINAFWKRKINRYQPADLSQIKKGQDALNGALDITYKNIVELDYLEQQALARYPELINDPAFINQVTNLRIKLNNNYNKLMKKNKTMEKYYLKTKHQIKILKPDMKRAS